MKKVFELSEEDVRKFDDWRKSKENLPVSTMGGAYEFCFTPTGVGNIVKVKCIDETELDLTDYSKW